MPQMRRCGESGALIFDLTPEEVEVKDLRENLQDLTNKVEEQLAILKKANKAKK